MSKTSVLDRLFEGREVQLPSLPAVGIKILDIVQKDNFSVKELASTISADPALTAKTLQMANSPLYALMTKVESIERAVTVLGSNTLKNISLSFVILEKLKDSEAGGFDYNFYWRRVVTAAVAADTLVGHRRSKVADAFVSALLMDIGVVLMFLARPDKYGQILARKAQYGVETAKAEIDVFGFDHTEVGREVLETWGIPESIYLPIGYRNLGSECPTEYLEHVDVLNSAETISRLYHGTDGMDRRAMAKLKESLQSKLGFEKSVFNEFLDEVAKKTLSVLSSFKISSGGMKPYSEILQDANEELGKLNAAYESIVVELQQANERSENLANMLKVANKRLKSMAFKDSLTGLYNHRFFHEMIDKEISGVERHSRVFSLVIFDLDCFKPINDTLGHKHGDNVLKGVSNVVSKTVRAADCAARIGGDEFAVLLPDTEVEQAVIFAERLRAAVEDLGIDFKEKSGLAFSVSVGVGACRPPEEKETKEQLIHEVDKALYKSKEEGRNRVSIVSGDDGSTG